MLQKDYYYHWKKKKKTNLGWNVYLFIYLGWGMGFVKAGLELCEFEILDYEGVVLCGC